MKWMASSIRNKILVLLLLATLLIVAIVGYIGNYLSAQIQLQNQHEKDVASLLHEQAQLMFHFKTQIQEWKNVLLRGHNAEKLDKYWSQFEAEEDKVQQLLERMEKASIFPAELLPLLQQFKAEHQKMSKGYQKGHKAYIDGGKDHKVGDSAVQGVDRQADKLLIELNTKMTEWAKQQTSDTEQHVLQDIRWAMTAVLIVIVIVGLILLRQINRQLVQPTNILEQHFHRISEGALSESIAVKRDDEIGQLANSASRLQTFLRDMLGSIGLVSSDLNTISNDLNKVSEDIVDVTATQHSRTDAVSTAMHEMTATAQDVSQHANNAAAAAEQADQSTNEGLQVMQEAVSKIKLLAKEMASMGSIIDELQENTANIGTVVTVINGIAEQTNLLALNAAIEAARAGEQGRGFAVVADEVRTLAQRTQDSTTEIQTIIENVQAGAKKAVGAMESSSAHTDESVIQVEQAGNSLQAISNAVANIREMNLQIATAAEEQTAVADDISRNIVDIASIADHTNGQSRHLSELGQQMVGLSDQLSQLVAKFKL